MRKFISIDIGTLKPPSLVRPQFPKFGVCGFIHNRTRKSKPCQPSDTLFVSAFFSCCCLMSNSSDDKVSACNAGDPDLIPESGRSPGEGNVYPLLYSRLENSMDRGVCQDIVVHEVAKSQT